MAVDSKKVAGRVLGGAVLCVAAYYALWGGEYSTFDLARIAEQRTVESTRIAATETEVDSLNALIAKLEDDPATIEAVARERFGMIKEGELLYRFVEPETGETADPTS
jgi:cell division protein FtsB